MKSTLFNMVAVLFTITLIASAGVGAVNMITADAIAAAKEQATKEAMANVLPAFDSNEQSEQIIDDMPIVVYKAVKGDAVVGYKADNESKYKIYLQVQDELTYAFNLYRDEISREVYGVGYDELDELQAANIRKAVPMKISEAEPNDQTKK